MAGVKVYANNPLWYNANIESITDNNGKYKIDVRNPSGSWKIHAELTRTYHDHTYVFYLYSESNSRVTDEGGVADFMWKLSGEIPEMNMEYGGFVLYHQKAMKQNGPLFAPEEIEFIMEPVDKLIDGNTGSTIVRKCSVVKENNINETGLKGIPVGRYRITARYVPQNGDAPQLMKIRLRPTDSYSDFIETDFEQQESMHQRIDVEIALP